MHSTKQVTPRTLGDHAWRDRAACRTTAHHQVEAELFFPEPDEMDRIHAAKALCAQCPVSNVCLDSALQNGDSIGIWGGMTEEEREPLHKKMEHRLDYSRVNEVLSGRDIFLTRNERRAVTRAAYQAELPPERLAILLKVTEEHAKKLYRRTRREIRNRAVAAKESKSKKVAKSKPQALNPPEAKLTIRDDLGTAA
ncbi:WhiB family transcriptional regulator [Actinomycetota bacterium Odt1-20B]